MRVRDYMTPNPTCANAEDGLHQTYYRMRERRIRHMPVLGDWGALIGIVSDRDLLRPSSVDAGPNRSGYFALNNAMQVREAMTPDPVTVSPEDALSDAVDLFLEHHFGAFPVVDADGALIGILSAIDALRAFQDHLGG